MAGISVEEMLDKISALPLETRRNMELLHTMDTRWMQRMTELRRAHDAYIKGVKSRVEKAPWPMADLRKGTEDPEALARISVLHKECLQVSEEKISVAKQAYDTVATAMDKLGADLRRFEAELRQNGDLVDEVRGRERASHSLSLCSLSLLSRLPLFCASSDSPPASP